MALILLGFNDGDLSLILSDRVLEGKCQFVEIILFADLTMWTQYICQPSTLVLSLRLNGGPSLLLVAIEDEQRVLLSW